MCARIIMVATVLTWPQLIYYNIGLDVSVRSCLTENLLQIRKAGIVLYGLKWSTSNLVLVILKLKKTILFMRSWHGLQ